MAGLLLRTSIGRRCRLKIPADNPLAATVVKAIQEGDVESVKRLLQDNPDLAKTRFGSPEKSRSLLHIAIDWPGHFPNVAPLITC